MTRCGAPRGNCAKRRCGSARRFQPFGAALFGSPIDAWLAPSRILTAMHSTLMSIHPTRRRRCVSPRREERRNFRFSFRARSSSRGSRHICFACFRRLSLPVITFRRPCSSAYARVDLEPDAYVGVVTGQGTTNVDFNAPFRAALAQVRDNERVGLAVGKEDVTLLRGADQIVERKVNLPVRWVKGFVEVQAYQSRMELRAELGKIETLRFLRSLPRSTQAKTAFWIVPAGAGLRGPGLDSRRGH
jgi:hypothetical protein